jgi:diaminopimelate epimerase
MNKTQASLDALEIGMQAPVSFTKMEGLGNDFIMVEEIELAGHPDGQRLLENLEEEGGKLAARLCDRRLGIGADGMIIVRKPERENCSVGWMYFNSDGSTSAMCGNGLRCLALYSVDTGLVKDEEFLVDTAVGARSVKVIDADIITTDLGVPLLSSQEVPISGEPRPKVVRQSLKVSSGNVLATCVSMGNPHCVVFQPPRNQNDWPALAAEIQKLEIFPEGTNVEFVQVLTPSHAAVYVHERGSGPTLACASGAAAVLVAGVLEGTLQRAATIELPGGSLRVWWSDSDDHVRITGPARTAFRGVFDLGLYCDGDSD